MKILRKIIEIDEELCDGCGECIPACPEGALQIVDGKARLVKENFCDGLGECIGKCPKGAIRIVEREAEAFDEEAVNREMKAKKEEEPMPCGCPSTHVRSLGPSPCKTANIPQDLTPITSELKHWPVQIRLVPPTAPFLKNAHLLVAADCTTIAYPAFHRDFLKDKVVMMGYPKFDDVQDYVNRFAQIFAQANIKKVTVLVMEVPCCSGLPMVVKKGMEMANVLVPLEVVVIGIEGNIIKKAQVA
jgi:NAD-dependent dihydropyrimidine dehydrogenase PreA subunit